MSVISLIERLLENLSVAEKSGDFELPTEFPWLLSDYRENTWKVRDPSSLANSATRNIHFDGPMIGGGRLSDNPNVIADGKLSLVMAVELNEFQNDSQVGSLSKMTSHVNCYKRIYNELLSLGFIGWDEWDESLNSKLFERLTKREVVSQNYFERIRNYVSKVGVENLPVYQHRSHPSRIDTGVIHKVLGLNTFAIRSSKFLLSYWEEVNCELNQLRPDLNIKILKERLGKSDEKILVHEKQYTESLGFIELINQQSNMFHAFFKLPWLKLHVNDRESLFAEADFKDDSRGRTRNIPVPLFLKTMDAAVRFVLDYADPLFEAEKKIKAEFERLEGIHGSYEAGRLTNGFARKLGCIVEGKHSPFPLAAYKQYSYREGTISDEWWDRFAIMMASGMTPKDIREELDISKSQYDGRRKMLLSDRYSSNLPHSGLSLNKALYQFLPLCCLLIIFSFSARRECEVFSLKKGCYDKTIDGWMIKFFVAKTFRGNDWFTTVPLVIKAIKILERLSEDGRKISGTESLFAFDDAFNRAPTNFDRLERGMDSFLDFIGVERNEEGNHFKFSEHQFRRFFAMMFFYRYEKGGDYEALMHELRHENWSMLELYITEKTCGQVLKEMEQERICDYGLRAFNEDDLSGHMAQVLRDELTMSIRIKNKNQRESALQHLKEKSLNIELISEGVCFGNSKGREEKSNCFSSGHVMCHRSSKEMCKGCPNLLSVAEIRENRHNNKFEVCNESSILNALVEE
jgi:hypothetical protein